MAKNWGLIGFVWNKLKSGVNNLWKGVTGSGLTDAQKEANEFTAQQAQNQMDFQQQMRDSQYQSAVQDMQKAGLNPALMYGSGASGNSAPSGAMGTSAQPSAPTLDPVGLLGQIANLRLLGSQARLLRSQANKNDQDVKESEERIGQIRANTRNLLATYDLIGNNIRNSALDADAKEIANKYLDREHQIGLKISGLTADQLSQNIKESEARVSKLNAEQQSELQRLVNLKQEYRNLVAQEHLTDAQAEQSRHMLNQIDAMTNNLIAQTNLTNEDITYYEWNHTKEVAPTKGHIDSKGNTITFGSSKPVQKAKKVFKKTKNAVLGTIQW